MRISRFFRRVRAVLVYLPLAILYIHLVFVQLTVIPVYLYKYILPPVTGIQLYRSVFFRWPTEAQRYLPLEKVPARIRTMIIRVEDGTFYQHHGVLPAAIKHAWKLNKNLGKPVYGGSTITMQTARTLFLVPEKSYLRKYLEVIIAFEMEWILGKDRIFELYLNNAEWGKGVYGIETASYYHFKKSVSKLSTEQAIRLVTLLSSPIKYGPYNLNKNAILAQRYAYLRKRFE